MNPIFKQGALLEKFENYRVYASIFAAYKKDHFCPRCDKIMLRQRKCVRVMKGSFEKIAWYEHWECYLKSLEE